MLEGRDPLIERVFGQKSLVSEKLAIDDLIAGYTGPWEPEFYSRLEDAAVAVGAMGFYSLYGDDDSEAEAQGGVWTLVVRADRLWTKRLGTLKITGDPDGDISLAII